MRKSIAVLAVALAISGHNAAQAQANDVADFYRGKTLTVYIGYGPGGGYDLYARTLARHITKHIPGNPQAVPSNMPGASSMTLGNFLARIAPRDGTAIGPSIRRFCSIPCSPARIPKRNSLAPT